MNKSISKYLKSGSQTEITPDIQKIAESFTKQGLDLILEILQWIHPYFEHQSSDKKNIFRKRTADEIIKSKMVTGCTDYALVFIALARAKGIPTKYIETIRRRWLDIGKEDQIEGHIFAECFINNNWYIVDPQEHTIRIDYLRFEIYKKGLDSWDIGIHNFDELKEQFLKFKRERKSE
ncbi:transglutaminase-like domain-containing protein [Patescibacteria group bacterium]